MGCTLLPFAIAIEGNPLHSAMLDEEHLPATLLAILFQSVLALGMTLAEFLLVYKTSPPGRGLFSGEGTGAAMSVLFHGQRTHLLRSPPGGRGRGGGLLSEPRNLEPRSSLTLNIAGICKELVTILIATTVAHDKHLSLVNVLGLLLSVSVRAKRACRQLPSACSG